MSDEIPKSASIEPLRSRGKSWGAKAAAGDAMQRVPNEAPFVAIWVEKVPDGDHEVVKWSKANTEFMKLGSMALVLTEFAQACVRQAFPKRPSNLCD